MAQVSTFFTEIFSKSSTFFATAKEFIPPEKRIISLKEVSLHDHADDCWIVIYDRIYDLTNFLDEVSFIILPSNRTHKP